MPTRSFIFFYKQQQIVFFRKTEEIPGFLQTIVITTDYSREVKLNFSFVAKNYFYVAIRSKLLFISGV